jgi:hypothetical protein
MVLLISEQLKYKASASRAGLQPGQLPAMAGLSPAAIADWSLTGLAGSPDEDRGKGCPARPLHHRATGRCSCIPRDMWAEMLATILTSRQRRKRYADPFMCLWHAHIKIACATGEAGFFIRVSRQPGIGLLLDFYMQGYSGRLNRPGFAGAVQFLFFSDIGSVRLLSPAEMNRGSP